MNNIDGLHGAEIALCALDAERSGWTFREVLDREAPGLTSTVGLAYSATDPAGREVEGFVTYKEVRS